MIPKIIHYCWFGGNPLPESAQKCIASWRKYLPDYEIWQWVEEINENQNQNQNGLSPALPLKEGGNNRENLNVNLFDKLMGFDVNTIPYTQQAYKARKYAFVSDYARFWILYKYGGLYFDTDVEVIKPFDDIVERGPFMGVELIGENGCPKINPGLGLGLEAKDEIVKRMLDMYATLRFLNADGTLNQKTIVDYTTEILMTAGLKKCTDIQVVGNLSIYPVDYFNPFDDLTGKLKITENTRSIHWYSKTWQTVNPMRIWLSRMSHRVFGMSLHKFRTWLAKLL